MFKNQAPIFMTIWRGIRRVSLRTAILRGLGTLFGLQIVILLILQLISMRRRSTQPQGSFPHEPLEPVIVGENELQLYNYGHDLYRAMLAAIDSAQESIYLETYIWKNDSIGQQIKDHLEHKAAEGVHVYVIYDIFANLVVPRAFKRFSPAIRTMGYRALRQPWHIIDPRRYALDHRKLLIVDGYTSFIGGYNIGDLYASTWRDTHLRIKGSAAADIAQSFVNFWNQHSQQDKQIQRHYQRRFNPRINVRGTSALRLMFPIRDMYIEAIDQAEHSIYLTNAYFVPDSVLLGALKAAAQRGVDVQILVPLNSNHVLVDWVSRSHYSECLKAGIRIFGYRNMLHAKTCTIDGQWSTIGTANIDRLSSIGNYEINVEVYSETLGAQMQALFTFDKSNTAELKIDQWLQRPWYVLASERILSPLEYLT